MWSKFGIMLLICFCALQSGPAAADRPGTDETRLLTLSDVLQMDGIGRALADRSGRWVLFEYIRPYDTYPDYGFANHAFGKSGHDIWRLDLTSDAPPERLPGLDPAAHNFLQTLSPDGRYLSVIEVRAGQTSLLILDLASGRILRPDPVPALSRIAAHEPVWISDHDLVYAALPPGAQPMEASLRMATGHAREAAWEAAWRGDQVTATEIRNDEGPVPVAGALICVDARTGQVRKLAEGRHAYLSLSPDGRTLAALGGIRMPGAAWRDPARLDSVRHILHLIDLDTEEVSSPLPELDIVSAGAIWSPTEPALTVFATGVGASVSEGRHWRIDAQTGTARRLLHGGLDLVSERERGLLQRPERAYALADGVVVFARPNADPADRSARFTYRDIASARLTRPDWYFLRPGSPPRILTGDLGSVTALPARIGAAGLDVVARDGVYRIHPERPAMRLTPDGLDRIRVHHASGFLAWPGSLPAARTAMPPIEADRDGARIVLRPAAAAPESAVLVEGRGIQSGAHLLAVQDAAGAQSDTLVYLDADAATQTLIVQPPGAAPDPRLVLNAHLRQVDWGRWEQVGVGWEDPDRPGIVHDLHVCVLMPPSAARTGAAPPVLLDIYPGARPNCDPRQPVLSYPDPQSPYLWAARGYAYARLSAPRELIRRDAGPIAGLPGLVAASREALVESGLIDPDRMILLGVSQGAVAALHVASEASGFAGLIAQNGWSDLPSHYLGPPGIYTDLHPEMLGENMPRYEAGAGSDFGIGATLFAAPELYQRNSPVLKAEQITLPVLLIHTDMDVFPKSQFDQMYAALARFGHPVRYVWYAGEGHGISSPANIRDVWDRMIDFVEASDPQDPSAEPVEDQDDG